MLKTWASGVGIAAALPGPSHNKSLMQQAAAEAAKHRMYELLLQSRQQTAQGYSEVASASRLTQLHAGLPVACTVVEFNTAMGKGCESVAPFNTGQSLCILSLGFRGRHEPLQCFYLPVRPSAVMNYVAQHMTQSNYYSMNVLGSGAFRYGLTVFAQSGC